MKTITVLKIVIVFLLCLSSTVSAKDTKNRSVAYPLEGKDLTGEKVRLTDLKGNVVVVSFWATWCGPCKKELRFLNDLLETKGKRGLRVIAVSIDGPESTADIRAVVSRYRLKMPVIHDKEGSIIATWNPRATVPFSVFVDRRSRVAYSHVGFSKSEQHELEKKINDLLLEKIK